MNYRNNYNNHNKNNHKPGQRQNDSLILMSIMSYYARQIFDGTKGFEFRKSPLRASDLNKQIFVYSAKDDKAIIGSFKVSKIHHGNVEQIMQITGYDKRPDGNEILAYYGNNPNCYALELYDVQTFPKPLTLKELRRLDPNVQLPQYFTYINPNSPIYKQVKALNNQLKSSAPSEMQ